MTHPRDHLRVEYPQPGVVLATIDRPDRRNALTDQLFTDLADLQTEVDADPQARADPDRRRRRLLRRPRPRPRRRAPDHGHRGVLRAPAALVRRDRGVLEDAHPGHRRGQRGRSGAGLGLAQAADIRICSTEARFNAAFVRIGLSAGDVGCSWALPRIVGLGRALEILLTGRFVDAEEALRIGLVSDVVTSDELMDRALATAALISSNSPFGTQLSKEVVHTNVDAPSLAAALELENRTQVLATRSPDMVEALTAFREKRAPVFGHT